MLPPFDPRPYPSDWHLHRDEERYLGFVIDRAREVEKPQPGDVMLFRWGRSYAHGGIVTVLTPLRVVHAYYPSRCVLEDEVARDAMLSDPVRKPRYFSFWTGE